MGRKAKIYPPGPIKRKKPVYLNPEALKHQSKRNPDREFVMLNLMKMGLDLDTSALAAGLTGRTLRNWRKKDKDFDHKVQEAHAIARATDVAVIHKAAQAGDWKAAAWKASRLHRKHYGDLAPVINVNAAPAQDFSKLSTEELRSLHEMMARAQPEDDE